MSTRRMTNLRSSTRHHQQNCNGLSFCLICLCDREDLDEECFSYLISLFSLVLVIVRNVVDLSFRKGLYV